MGRANVFFNVGVDEHGLKLYSTAQKSGKSPQQFLADLVPKWIDFCSKFNISYDHFYRTSSEDHHHGAKKIWNICNDRNDIYKKHYEGFYCIGCEAFILERDLVDGKCSDHGSIPIWQSEENYFFKLFDIRNESLIESEFKSRIEHWKNRIEHFYIEYELFDAIATIFEMITYGNKYIHDNEPWKLDKSKASVILNNISYLTQVATYLLEPIIPEGANRTLIAIKKKEKTILYPKL